MSCRLFEHPAPVRETSPDSVQDPQHACREPRPSADDPELGATTAEYAILTLAAVAFAGILAVVIKSGPVQQLLQGVIERALSNQ